MAKLRGSAGTNGAALTALADVERLNGEVETLTDRAASAETALAAANAEMGRLQDQERNLAAVIAETGFAAAESNTLPAGDDGDGAGDSIANRWHEFERMPKGSERSEFYQKHRKEILAAQAADPAAG